MSEEGQAWWDRLVKIRRLIDDRIELYLLTGEAMADPAVARARANSLLNQPRTASRNDVADLAQMGTAWAIIAAVALDEQASKPTPEDKTPDSF